MLVNDSDADKTKLVCHPLSGLKDQQERGRNGGEQSLVGQ